ncbi:Uncharacterized protein APZ42_001771 [Daphnia magna]|uniref:Uncharacterized protein n=1 Tax=Daphnia magna TaxID=35525 RepID=A0A164IRE9_9CRUS|nr:Uncharacterized protein APZ42_001771 [Daphnia magna]
MRGLHFSSIPAFCILQPKTNDMLLSIVLFHCYFTLSSSKHVSNQIILGKPCLQLIIMLVPSEGIHILLTTGY